MTGTLLWVMFLLPSSRITYRNGDPITPEILASWKATNADQLATCNENCCNRPRATNLRKLAKSIVPLRPHILLFDEFMPENSQEMIQQSLQLDAEISPSILLIVGTSLSKDVNEQETIISHFKKSNPKLKIVHLNPANLKSQKVYISFKGKQTILLLNA
ncbi:hypothetical protein BC833DRAFT_660048 [Globomyces pollinis-pini]|nr:hypothetical protein BC833DRAFT_660048 [Globomyces pollinis-pini]